MINKIIEVQKALAKKQREWSERQREWFESFKSRDKVNIDDYINAGILFFTKEHKPIFDSILNSIFLFITFSNVSNTVIVSFI